MDGKYGSTIVGRTSTTRVQIKTVSSSFNVQHRSPTYERYERSQVRTSSRILTVITADPSNIAIPESLSAVWSLSWPLVFPNA